MTVRPDDTIVLPQRTTRADGVDPDVAAGRTSERAIFSHPGVVSTVESGRWIPAIDVRLSKVIAVVAAFDTACTLTLMKNATVAATMEITDLTQQMALDPIALIAEVDTLWVVVEAGATSVTNLTVFVSFL